MTFEVLTIAYFTPRQSFDPQRQFVNKFSGTVLAGTGITIAWSYTVPEGKRAVLESCQVQSDTETVNEVWAVVDVFDGTNNVKLTRAGMAQNASLGLKHSMAPKIILLPGMEVRGRYRNADTANDHYLEAEALITECE